MNPAQSDAHRVVTADQDLEVATRLAEALRDGAQVTAVFRDPDVAHLYGADPRVHAVAWEPLLTRDVVEQFPPQPLHSVAPEPVVVGDTTLAGRIVAALVENWTDPGQELGVHCVGQHVEWVQEAELETTPRSRLTWTESPLRPRIMAHRVAELAAQWKKPKAKHGTATGPTVIVALAHQVTCVMVAAAVAATVGDSRVAAVVDQGDIWPDIPGVTLFSVAEAQQAAVSHAERPLERLQLRLLQDAAWMNAPDAEATRPLALILAPVNYGEGGVALPWAGQSAMLRDQLASVAAGIEQILALGTVELSAGWAAGDGAIVLTPGELQRMASALLELLGAVDTDDTRLTALELASRLPALASRAGFAPRRPADYEAVLAAEQVELLAPLVHFAYQDVSEETDNATGSPLAYAMWEEMTEFYRASNRAVLVGSAVTHAALGLDWRRAQPATGRELTEEQIRRAGELEHRRWALAQRRQGAQDHEWMKPWSKVPENTRLYDFRIMEAVPGILAQAGIELFAPAEAT